MPETTPMRICGELILAGNISAESMARTGPVDKRRSMSVSRMTVVIRTDELLAKIEPSGLTSIHEVPQTKRVMGTRQVEVEPK